MKKIILSLALAAIAAAVSAVPAKRGIWKTVSLADGSQVRVELIGDEHASYWRAADGTAYHKAAAGEAYERVDVLTLVKAAQKRRAAMQAKAPAKAPQRAFGQPTSYTGQKKGIIILTQFADKKFADEHTPAMFNDMANTRGYSNDMGVKGSVKDYFIDQSNGQFELDFDVVGPVTLSHDYSYYGADNGDWKDTNASQMIKEACQLANPSVNFADYDWDGNGEVEQVFVLYAGYGQASCSDANTVWPHESKLGYYVNLTLDGVRINTYACGNEINQVSGDILEGIGTICHEFSHCLGIPDMYDVNYNGNFGMGPWDVMDQGCNLGDGHRPCNYTAYERWFCGWIQPTELTGHTDIKGVKSTTDHGDAYIMYNQANHNEYYILENRQQTGWDDQIFANGLMITHVDYRLSAWQNNEVNTTGSHQRCTIFHADNQDGMSTYQDIAGDLYPYNGNSSLMLHSAPANTLYNNNSDGTKNMHLSIIGIKKNSDGTVDFSVRTNEELQPKTPEGSVFYESFDYSFGAGGNDGTWAGTGTAALVTDKSGWSDINAYGGFQCARFGTNRTAGNAITPAIVLNEPARITFKAAICNSEATKLTLSVSRGTAELSQTEFPLVSGQWKECSADINGTGNIKLAIKANRGRFFLDEVNVTPLTTLGVQDIKAPEATAPKTIYTLDGRRAGTDKARLAKGVYVSGGRKIIIK